MATNVYKFQTSFFPVIVKRIIEKYAPSDESGSVVVDPKVAVSLLKSVDAEETLHLQQFVASNEQSLSDTAAMLKMVLVSQFATVNADAAKLETKIARTPPSDRQAIIDSNSKWVSRNHVWVGDVSSLHFTSCSAQSGKMIKDLINVPPQIIFPCNGTKVLVYSAASGYLAQHANLGYKVLPTPCLAAKMVIAGFFALDDTVPVMKNTTHPFDRYCLVGYNEKMLLRRLQQYNDFAVHERGVEAMRRNIVQALGRTAYTMYKSTTSPIDNVSFPNGNATWYSLKTPTGSRYAKIKDSGDVPFDETCAVLKKRIDPRRGTNPHEME
jgi:hypothetical protein